MAKDRVIIDCRKAREAEQNWKRRMKFLKPIKELGPSAMRQRVTGTAKGAKDDFAQVERKTALAFTTRCECSLADIEGDRTAYEEWKSAQRSAKATGHTSQLSAISKRLRGYYELYHHATSKRWTPQISISILRVGDFDATRSCIKCELHDSNRFRPYFHLNGAVRLVSGFLHWELKYDSLDAVCHGFSYLPSGEKYPGSTLHGIFLSLAGDDKLDYPVAARGVLRFLGETPSAAIKNSIVDLSQSGERPEDLLQKRVGGYLHDLQKNEILRSDVLQAVQNEILPRIRNTISENDVPLALDAPR